MDKSSPTICLNMIVKNESKIIVRLLLSALPIIDTYCICDTGSTDDTIQIIEDFFNKNKIKGKIVKEQFVNFAVNRTFALKAAKGMADYALLLDADMILVIGDSFKKESLNKDVYMMIQKGGDLTYYNTRIVSLKLDIVVKSPTHEYYDIPNPHTSGKLAEDDLYISDIGDGGCKADKFERDIRLFKEALKEEPDNCRYYFYLGESHFNNGDHAGAIPFYKRRIELGSWIEEVFYSHLRLGHCYVTAKDEPNMLYHWITAYQVRPTRAESLYYLINHYRNKGEHYKAWIFYNIAKDIPFPKDDVLFIEHDVYNYKILYEYTIIAYYIGHLNIASDYFKLMKIIPQNQLYSLLGNYKFYNVTLKTPSLTICLNDSFQRIIAGLPHNFVASSPSIIPFNDGYALNQRYVSYKIRPDGSYDYNKYIITINRFIELSKSFEKIASTEIQVNETPRSQYIGIEDVKIIQFNDGLWYTGTCYSLKDKIGISGGKYNNGDLVYNEFTTANEAGCEKNWVYIPSILDSKRMVYNWHPLTIGELRGNNLEIREKRNTPPFFSLARGSSNGFAYNDEIWFVIHFVHNFNNEVRQYYHSIVVFDKDMVLKRFTRPFKFTGDPIEYCLGIIVENSRVIMSHSVWDRESYIRIYPKDYLETLF